MFEELLKYPHVVTPLKVNKLRITKHYLDINEEGARTLNSILDNIDTLERKGEINRIVRTRSGGISYSAQNFRPPMYDIIEEYTEKGTFKSVEVVIIAEYSWRIVFARAYSSKKDDGINGYSCYKKICGIAQKLGLYEKLEAYAIKDKEKALKVKEQIESPKIELENGYQDMTYMNVNHLDLNSAHISGMAEFAPELRPIWEEIYQKKRTSPKGSAERELYKAILTHTWGFFQSAHIGYKYAELSKAGIGYTNRRIEELRDRLRAAGRIPFLYNTDGIWYIGEPFHDIDEGEELGQWKNDHLNCTLRAKSAGAYEFIENGEYTPVVRGSTRLDKAKPRTKWEWGDIYSKDAEIFLFKWNTKTRRIEVL